MDSLQRTKIAHCDFKLYKSLGPLIKDYRQWRQLTQESLAESIGISLRELQYWEQGRRNAHIGNLHDFSEITGIPMQVCVVLNADQPIWYSLQKRVFAYSLMEAAQLRIDDSLENRKEPHDGVFTRDDRITTDKHINAILTCHRQIYGTERLLGREVIKRASMILPDLNRIVFDCWGHYVGHHVCLPIKMNVYAQIKKGKVVEDHLTSEKISDIAALNEGVFFSYSSFAVSVSVAYAVLINTIRYQAKIKQKERYLVAFYPPPIEIKEFFKNLDLRIAFKKARDYSKNHAEVDPPIYEIELDSMLKSLRPFGALLGLSLSD